MAEQVYATLLLSDPYLPGALVLAQSLREAGATRKLACLVTPETVAAEVITELNSVYDYVIHVDRVRNDASPENLHLMGRPDLHSAFTKIQLWKQTQFSKIVYIDADVVALRAPEELFALESAFSAAPDIGWPDLFNTGVMVLTPNETDYNALTAMANEGTSFDGADQGLLNMYFGDKHNRISFTYNVTPSAHYQYVPAYLHFKDKISLVHFIGPDKPWATGRPYGASDNAHTELVNKWWAVYDRHYGTKDINNTTTTSQSGVPTNIRLVKYFVRGEFKPAGAEEQVRGFQETGIPYKSAWDAQRSPPPLNSHPEAWNLPNHRYNMSNDLSQFVPPRYPSPPRNLWYNVPDQEAPKQIFPWEAQQPKPSRLFTEEEAGRKTPKPIQTQIQTTTSESQTDAEPGTPTTATTMSTPGSPVSRAEPETPTTPTLGPHSSSWTSYTTRTNAWDDVPEIDRYVSGMRGGVRGATGRDVENPVGGQKPAGDEGEADEDEDASAHPPLRLRGLRLTDFPVDRPSLPVTPAPIRRPMFWGGGADPAIADDDSHLPSAEGVPAQSEWDPVAQLEKLASQGGELMRKLSSQNDGGIVSPREIPARALPFGSDMPRQSPPAHFQQQTYGGVLAPTPVKGGNVNPAENIQIQQPEYTGPGLAWEKGEDVPLRETPALPTEETRDLLEA